MDEDYGDDQPRESRLHKWNRKLTQGWLGRYFECEKRDSSVFQELRAGTVCFLTVSYIIPVNASILAETGGSCDPKAECTAESYEMFGDTCRFRVDSGYESCLHGLKIDLIAATCISSMIATLLMSLIARMPIAVAPAMGVNAYFTYNVVGFLHTQRLSYKQALAAVFIEGCIFLGLAITGIRSRIMELIPMNIMYSTAAGIGCFLAFIGLQHNNGIGLVTYDGATLVTLGGCGPSDRGVMFSMKPDDITFDNICKQNEEGFWIGEDALGPRSSNVVCMGGELQSATLWLGFAGGMLMVALLMKGVRASILVGILFVTFISWIPTHEATYFKERSSIPGGEERYWFFRKGATVPTVDRTALQLDFGALGNGDTWVALITFLYLDFLDATSTMFAMAHLVGEEVPGFIDAKGRWPRQLMTMCADGVASIVGSLLGTSPLTVFAESAVGIREGGRTGICSFMVAFGFFISMFLSPIFASIPPYGTGPAIILVGSLMMEHSRYVAWDDIRQAVPAFLTIIVMPLTYSIAYGLITGLLAVVVLWAVDFMWESFLVLTGYYQGDKTMYHVWLDTMSHLYVSLDREDILIRDLPGYAVEMDSDAASGCSLGGTSLEGNSVGVGIGARGGPHGGVGLGYPKERSGSQSGGLGKLSFGDAAKAGSVANPVAWDARPDLHDANTSRGPSGSEEESSDPPGGFSEGNQGDGKV
uniref:Xanthine/uracil/vitamin C permease n=1 Tax=Dunaliella tertiolecta TaxID=3047 RepID=A0A7S3QU41_DUNTE